ncbi:biotin--[acetyl-CoA-carboxylase] ligase [Corynebacterium glyciniphilum]|uniref:biotin--[biotin carboxyl-carrier protein] ligase n=1 Tax=Corynebacterium glyciniphilum AJ 3170 TaxID=1404245 RepID=X5E7E1_9CORY|nr:biotin--[acetyl-CoA-carboxylase] ligase [Corynebacterium glyciniphilum]AHW63330.1 Biotin-protein ligase [Corynebacterium glyciniphilum AJ 3170]
MTASPTASRTPFDASRLSALIQDGDSRVGPVTVVGTTGSTNADLADAFRADPGLADRTVIVAEEQVTARGRLGRRWSAPAGAQVIMSVLLRPSVQEVPAERFGELPLLIGVAIAETARAVGVDAQLKWPNDVIVSDRRSGDTPHGYRKLAGILVEAVSLDPVAVVVGVGVNASITAGEFADAGVEAGTSLTDQGAELGSVQAREALAAAELSWIADVDEAWRRGGAALEKLRRRYRELSATLGTRVRAELPGGEELTGTAVDLDGQGGLVIETVGGERRTVTAGDVVHLRPVPTTDQRN